eukprot:366547-Chlamydomonas_euryale.AAC.7
MTRHSSRGLAFRLQRHPVRMDADTFGRCWQNRGMRALCQRTRGVRRVVRGGLSDCGARTHALVSPSVLAATARMRLDPLGGVGGKRATSADITRMRLEPLGGVGGKRVTPAAITRMRLEPLGGVGGKRVTPAATARMRLEPLGGVGGKRVTPAAITRMRLEPLGGVGGKRVTSARARAPAGCQTIG